MGSEALKAANTMQVRQHNKTVIRQAMLCLRQATRPQLAQKTGLSQVTVSAVLAELMEKGEVENCGSVPSEGGRPSACYRYRGERHNAGVLYTYQMEGRTLVQLEVFDLFGDRVDRASQFLGDLRPESFDALLDAAFQETPGIRTLALGVPGQVEGDKILFCDHRALAGDALSRRWKGRYHVPVLLENDVNAAVLGYVQGLRGEVAGLTAGLYFPGRFGPGMGLALGRSPWPGRQGFVGEFHYLYGLDQWNGMDHGNPAAVEETAARYLRAVCVGKKSPPPKRRRGKRPWWPCPCARYSAFPRPRAHCWAFSVTRRWRSLPTCGPAVMRLGASASARTPPPDGVPCSFWASPLGVCFPVLWP